MENTVKVYLLGAAAVIVSAVKLEDWKRVEKYAPEALKVLDEEGEPSFRVMTTSGGGSANRLGIAWGSYTSEEGYATVTILLDEDVDDKKAAVMDVVGSALMELAEIEKKVPALLADIDRKEQEIGSCIIAI